MKARCINPVLRTLRLLRKPIIDGSKAKWLTQKGILYSFHQLSDRCPQRFSYCLNRKKARILDAALDTAQKCPVDIGFGGKGFLRQFFLCPEFPNLLTKSLGNIMAHLHQFCPFKAVNGCRLYTTNRLDGQPAHSHDEPHRIFKQNMMRKTANFVANQNGRNIFVKFLCQPIKTKGYQMRTVVRVIIGAAALLFASAIHSFAITNTMITVSSGTNILLYWPSYGYETYLIQYRQTLSATDSWSQLTNAYYANGTNFTTYTLYGVVPPPSSGGSGGSGGGTNPPPPLPDQPMVEPASGTGTAAPLALYPPGFDLTGFNIFDPATGEWTSGNGKTVSATYDSSLIASGATPMDGGISPDDSTNDVSGPQTGFFRVFEIPDWLADVSDYTFNGPTFIPVNYSFPDAPTNEIESSQVLINGQPFDGAVFTPDNIDGTTYWGMGIYFDLLPNGTNTIQLLTTVRESDTLNDQTPYMVFSNAPQTIVVGNSISYTNWSPLILSNSYTFNAQSSVSNVGWEIDIYDVNDDFVNSQTGYSADGNISWTWNLTDYTGASRLDDSDPFFFAYLTVTNSSGDPGGWMPALANQFPATGDWIVSYLDNFYDDGTSNYAGADNYYTNGLNTLEGGPLEWSIGEIQVPLKYGRVYSQTNRNASWDNFRDWLESWNNRNLYYFGHGSANSIGGDINTLDSSNNITGSETLPGSTAYLTAQWVHDNVTYNSVWGPMPFRFVFLDGCDTATGNWPWAWGVPKQTVGPDWYQNSTNNPSGSRPNAFAGWDVEIGGNKAWGTVQGFWTFRDDWMSEWTGNPDNESLAQAFTDAFTISNWVSPGQYNHLKYYGFTSILFLQYNNSGDW